MQKMIVLWVCVWFLWFIGAIGALADEYVWDEIGDGARLVSAVLIRTYDQQEIYYGSSKGVFKSQDGGRTWSLVLALTGGNQEVNILAYDGKIRNCIYAATSAGLFQTKDVGNSWKKIFVGKNILERQCTAVLVTGNQIYLGTKGGLFLSGDNGSHWQREPGAVGRSPVKAIASLQESVYVACVDGIFRKDGRSGSWEKVFIARLSENCDESPEQSDDQDKEGRVSIIRYVAIDCKRPGLVYCATSEGVYQSFDSGASWRPMTQTGLLEKDVRFLFVSDDGVLYVTTDKAVYVYHADRWEILSLRLAGGKIKCVAIDKEASLYAACENGLFKSAVTVQPAFAPDTAGKPDCQQEPDISQVQEAAIRYAEVAPEKIQRWRRLAAKKPWLPQVSVGVNRKTSDLWHWESGSTTKECDDTLRKGHDSVEWDMRLSWDLADLIWSDDQLAIDVRSKLMVELRDDVLDETTKLYFERKRLMAELEESRIFLDKKKKTEKQLRIEELTAYLNGLTGGYFSSYKQKANPAPRAESLKVF